MAHLRLLQIHFGIGWFCFFFSRLPILSTELYECGISFSFPHYLHCSRNHFDKIHQNSKHFGPALCGKFAILFRLSLCFSLSNIFLLAIWDYFFWCDLHENNRIFTILFIIAIFYCATHSFPIYWIEQFWFVLRISLKLHTKCVIMVYVQIKAINVILKPFYQMQYLLTI